MYIGRVIQLIKNILRSRLSIISLLFAFILFQLYYYKLNSNNDLYYLRAEEKEEILINRLKGVNNGNKVYVNDHNLDISQAYTNLIKDYGETFNNYPFHNKCAIYFDSLYKTDHNWALTDFHDLPYDGGIFNNREGFIKNSLNTYKEEKYKDMDPEKFKKMADERELNKVFEIDYQRAVKETRDTERKLIDASTHLRVYGACYLDQYGTLNKLKSTPKIEQQCLDIEMRMFPWLSRRMPKYTRWDGTIKFSMPIMSEYTEQKYEYKPTANNCYMKSLKSQLNGKGITLSAKDSHFDQLSGLLPLLRALGNKLPIEIVHKGDMSEEVQNKLIGIARMDTPKLSKIENLNHVLQLRNISNFDSKNKTQMELLFPKQELWFVDVQNAISDNYQDKFHTYANKLLAYFFNSFQDCILMDADTIPLVDLETKILGSNAYENQGAYFFKDRELYQQGEVSDRKFFSKLMPSKIDTAFFGIPKTTDFTMKNRFIGGGFWHYMESGIVAIDKVKHFTGVLTTLQLQIWAPAASKVWGDKELFWLGLSISGDENYYMNKLASGSVGQLTPKIQRLFEGTELIGRELCSTHPAHISSEDNSTLLWINSGFQFCKKEKAQEDMEKDFFKKFPNIKSVEDLDHHYKNYIKIEAVIVPKHAEYHEDRHNGENSRGWGLMNECERYLYCAYDKVAGKDDEETNGLLVEFSEEQRKLYDFYGSVWINGQSIFSETLHEKE
ncbi:Alpha-1,3-mannosyltransferase MNN1 [Wickerhamomyces ciferrii]|uniref:Alpha-1,3-mannosyltransferase MNN1 n=1 Tax=Wickerhamomyces ciferrii (strain ATCC 14091 / BCRC 22168 / CBS 111 / JCM 3599 / NBRC 0793 / NRRL Y-1031 F-60-10) TaxID=1206466 RepID=K0KVM2_WICCF|nr:Alpha-1,3-mannosyltransferase MNN1 [Wickerhamomyces ciferrii]CCH45992.1 Alpha-1,3-mannosyltransferase MNN1 [Wickerhamomyces ciferrii]